MRQLVIVNGSASDQKRITNLADAWKSSPTHQALEQASDETLKKESGDLSGLVENFKPVNLMAQIFILFSRNINRVVKDKLSFQARVGQNIFLSLIVGLIYLDTTLNQRGVQNLNGAIFCTSPSMTSGGFCV